MICSHVRVAFANDLKLGFFPIAAEMRDPSQYTRALLICQTALTSIYIAIGTVIYYYCGSYVASPALGSAGTLIKKVAYGIALPGLVASTVIVLHVSDMSGLIFASFFLSFFLPCFRSFIYFIFLTKCSSQANISSSASYEDPNI